MPYLLSTSGVSLHFLPSAQEEVKETNVLAKNYLSGCEPTEEIGVGTVVTKNLLLRALASFRYESQLNFNFICPTTAEQSRCG